MKHIKIGVRGFKTAAPAEFVEEASNAISCMWVELPSGTRIDAEELTAVRLEFRPDAIATTTVEFHNGEWSVDGEVDLIGAPFVVLVDRDGKPLPHKEDNEE